MPTQSLFIAQNQPGTFEETVTLKVVYRYGGTTALAEAYMIASKQVLTRVYCNFATNNPAVTGTFTIPAGATESNSAFFTEGQSIHVVSLGMPTPQRYLNQSYVVT